MNRLHHVDQHQLSSPWPSFLEILDADPNKAFEQLYVFAVHSLTLTPPPALLRFDESERLDIIHAVVWHCVKDGFQNLRKYKQRERPFAGWLYVTAYNKSSEEWRKRNRQHRKISVNTNSGNHRFDDCSEKKTTNIESRVEGADLLSKVLPAIQQMDSKCRLLLMMACDEFTIGEMVIALRLPKDHNAKVSDALRYCRKKLYKLLANKGMEVVL